MAYIDVFLKTATVAFDALYTYEVTDEEHALLRPGMLVTVPFGRGDRTEEAIVFSVEPREIQDDINYKSITAILDTEAALLADQLDLIEQLRIRYSCTYGDAARLMLPPGAGHRSAKRRERTAYLANTAEAIELLNAGMVDYMNQIHVLEFLLNYGESAVTDVLAACQITISTLNTMRKKGWLLFGEREAAVPTEDELPEADTPPAPTPGQKNALTTLVAALDSDSRRIREYLLRGITGSGKTEVYLQLSAEVLERGKTAIILVPEISLTPQMTDRFRARFGDRVAVIHSRLTQRERHDQWLKILRQEVSLVVGARSAIFSPLENLGLIVIDEEQEGSYRSEMKPKYHARTVARLRVRGAGALLLLGSATPDVESYHRTETGRSNLLELSDRPGSSLLPEAKIVDMRDELGAGNFSPFSRELHVAMEEAFSKGEQVILFLNRRGYAGIWMCPDCGKSVSCPHCSVAMTYHMAFRNRPASLQCHYCGLSEAATNLCRNCGGKRMQAFGLGTEQLEEQFKQIFPEQRILRMDQDTTIGRGSHHEIVNAFRRREADVLLGTQMIAKGHDFPRVTVVGILAADQLLALNDFRAKERAFQLITQAAGRAGRADRPGRVYIQAFDSEDYALKHALAQDYEAFYRDEILFRQTMLYPPFSSLGQVLLSGQDDREVRATCETLRTELQGELRRRGLDRYVEFTPISRAAIARIKRRYRWQFTLKAEEARQIVFCFEQLQKMKLGEHIRLSLDLDPA